MDLMIGVGSGYCFHVGHPIARVTILRKGQKLMARVCQRFAERPLVTLVVGVFLYALPVGCTDSSSGAQGPADAGVMERSLCEVDPCSSPECDRSMISCPEPPAVGVPELASDLAVDRLFDCAMDGLDDTVSMGTVTDLEGAFFSARPADGPCLFDLVFNDGAGAQTVISQSPAGYLFPTGKRLPNGDIVACVNVIQHRAHEPESTQRHMERVSIACTRQTAGTWGPMVPMVVPDGPWAAWLHPKSFGNPAAIPGDDGNDQFPIMYARDFSFQFLNTIDTGRPGTDGYYRQNLELNDGRLARLGPAFRVSSIAEGSMASDVDANWEPTEAEIAEFEAFIEEMPDGPEVPEGGMQ